MLQKVWQSVYWHVHKIRVAVPVIFTPTHAKFFEKVKTLKV